MSNGICERFFYLRISSISFCDFFSSIGLVKPVSFLMVPKKVEYCPPCLDFTAGGAQNRSVFYELLDGYLSGDSALQIRVFFS